MTEREYAVTLDGGGPWGFRLQGGKDFGTPLKVARITPGSKAAVKQLNPGDIILEINGGAIEGLTHMEAQNVIKNAGSVLTLKLRSCTKVLEQTTVIHSANVDHKFNSKPRAFAPTSPTTHTSSTSFQASTPSPSQSTRTVVSTPKFSPAEYAQKKKEELENRKNQTSAVMEESEVLRMLKESNLSDEQKARKQSGSFQKLDANLHHDNGGSGGANKNITSISIGNAGRAASSTAPAECKSPTSPAGPISPDVFRMTYTGHSVHHEVPDGTHVIDDLRQKMEKEDARARENFEIQKKAKEQLAGDSSAAEEEADPDIDAIRHNPGIYKGGSNPSKVFKYLQYMCGELDGSEASVSRDRPTDTEFEQEVQRGTEHKEAAVVPSQAFQLLQRLTDGGEELPPPPPELMGESETDYVRPTFGGTQGNPSKTFQKLQSSVASGDGDPHPSVFSQRAQSAQNTPSPSKYGPKGQTSTSVNPIPKAPMPSGPSFKINAPSNAGGATFQARSPTSTQPPVSPVSPNSSSPQPVRAAQKIGVRPTPQPVPGKVDTKNPHCAKCDEIIKGPFVSAIGKTWHPEHFACASCATSLQNQGFVEEQGQLYCERCYNEFFAPKCATCGKSVVGNCVNAIGKAFHPEHFVCASCSKSFGNQGFLVEGGRPYCENCYDDTFGVKCAGCDRTITGGEKYVEAMDRNYHSTCFKCNICHVRLEGSSFFLSGGRTFCAAHKNGH